MILPTIENYLIFCMQSAGILLIFYVFVRLLSLAVFKSYFFEKLKFCYTIHQEQEESNNGKGQEEKQEEKTHVG
ncbi:unnamed protein product [marine sediment metagenome]|uniref:Uncharacterized protein n=1 Tax=marine sediment metagenome TaxID=412755 RepID=X1BQ80_9ZZZZ